MIQKIIRHVALCDQCGKVYGVGVTTEFADITILRLLAEESGWRFSEDSQVCYCPMCGTRIDATKEEREQEQPDRG